MAGPFESHPTSYRHLSSMATVFVVLVVQRPACFGLRRACARSSKRTLHYPRDRNCCQTDSNIVIRNTQSRLFLPFSPLLPNHQQLTPPHSLTRIPTSAATQIALPVIETKRERERQQSAANHDDQRELSVCAVMVRRWADVFSSF